MRSRHVRDEDRIMSFPTHRCEGGVDLGAGVGVVDLELHSHRSGGCINVFQFGRPCIGGIDKHSDAGRPGQQISKHFQSLCSQLDKPPNQVGRHRWQPVKLIFSSSADDRYVLAFDVTDLFQALSKSTQPDRDHIPIGPEVRCYTSLPRTRTGLL